jgi:hypothetical protein
LERGEPVYLVERRTSPIFKWHADLDLLAEREITSDELVDVAKEVQRCMAVVLGDQVLHKRGLLILRAPPVQKEDKLKTGVHLIAPALKVDVEQCAAIRDLALPQLKLRPLPLLNTWEDAFDLSVYKGSGLRMLGSRKIEYCKCSLGVDCIICQGTGKVDAGRAYVVDDVLDADGKRDDRLIAALRRNTGGALKYASIRCYDDMQVRTRPLFCWVYTKTQVLTLTLFSHRHLQRPSASVLYGVVAEGGSEAKSRHR